MNGYLVPLGCLCGSGVLRPVAEGRPVAGTEVSAAARCVGCGQEWHVHVHLRPLPREADVETLKRQRNTDRQRERRARLKAAT